MSDNALVVWCFAIFCIVCLLCVGDPDIIDGITKRLNGAPCQVEQSAARTGADTP